MSTPQSPSSAATSPRSLSRTTSFGVSYASTRTGSVDSGRAPTPHKPPCQCKIEGFGKGGLRADAIAEGCIVVQDLREKCLYCGGRAGFPPQRADCRTPENHDPDLLVLGRRTLAYHNDVPVEAISMIQVERLIGGSNRMRMYSRKLRSCIVRCELTRLLFVAPYNQSKRSQKHRSLGPDSHLYREQRLPTFISLRDLWRLYPCPYEHKERASAEISLHKRLIRL